MTDILPNDAIGTVAVNFADALGRLVSAPAGVTFSSSDENIATVAFDGSNLTVTPVADGTITIIAAGLTGSLEVTVSAPAAVAVAFGPMTYAPK